MSDSRLSLLISISLHLLLISLLIAYKFSPTPPSIRDTILIMDFQVAQKQVKKSVKESKIGHKSQPTPNKVNLPKSMIQTSMRKIVVPLDENLRRNNFNVEQKLGNNILPTHSELSEVAQIDEKNTEKITFDEQLFSDFSKEINSEKINSEFLLEGEILQRELLKKELPVYPSGIQKNSSVVMSFEVTPFGDVENIVVIKKSFSQLEEQSLKALKNWKFNSILINENQKGTITFIYELE